MEFYAEDLAYVHDSNFNDVAKQAATMIIATLKTNNICNGLVVDLGSGSGIIAKQLIKAGYKALGIEQSKAFIKIAKAKAPSADFLHGSLFKVPIPLCEAVISTGECLNYLFDETNNEQSIMLLFQNIYKSLKPGGIFIFDLLTLSHKPIEYKKIFEEKNWSMFLSVKKNQLNKTLIREITLFRKKGNFYRKSKELHNVILYDKNFILTQLKACGFVVTKFNHYENIKFKAEHLGFICKKMI